MSSIPDPTLSLSCEGNATQALRVGVHHAGVQRPDAHPSRRGGVVQVDPMKPKLKPKGSKRLIVKCEVLLSNFAFKFNLRLCTVVPLALTGRDICGRAVTGRGLHSSTSQPSLSRF